MEELQEKLESFGTELLEYVKQGAEFAIEQAPLVAQEIIAWGITEAAGWALVGSLMVAVGTKLLFVARKMYLSADGYDDGYFPFVAVGVVVVGIGLMVACFNFFKLAYVLVAPRLYLLDQLSYLFSRG